jgi:hypothetical protein
MYNKNTHLWKCKQTEDEKGERRSAIQRLASCLLLTDSTVTVLVPAWALPSRSGGSEDGLFHACVH